MDQSRRPFGIILCAVILVLTGCRSGPPPEQVRSFSTAVTEMRNAGNLLYDKLGAALPEAAPATAADRNCANAVRLGVPCRFDPATAGVGSGARADRPEVAARRLALDLVSSYGLALATLAEGRDTTQLQAEVDTLVGIASSLLVLSGSAAPAGIALRALRPQVSELAVSIEGARGRAELQRAILANRTKIHDILGFLIEDSRTVYDIYLNARMLRRLDQAANAREFNQQRAATRDDINGFNASLAAYVTTLRAADTAYERLALSIDDAGRPTASNVESALGTTARFGARAAEFWETVRRSGAVAR